MTRPGEQVQDDWNGLGKSATTPLEDVGLPDEEQAPRLRRRWGLRAGGMALAAVSVFVSGAYGEEIEDSARSVSAINTVYDWVDPADAAIPVSARIVGEGGPTRTDELQNGEGNHGGPQDGRPYDRSEDGDVEVETDAQPTSGEEPAAEGYFDLVEIESLDELPSDSEAAEMVHRSTWEPRPENAEANRAAPDPASMTELPGTPSMDNREALFGRVTGDIGLENPTTDEIFQWASAKWGLPDNLLRAVAVGESNWYQNHQENGEPVRNHGYGDYGHGEGSPAESGYGPEGPTSFSIMQIKWFSHPNTWPNSETSTAYAVDFYGAQLRGCYEGWENWLSKYGDYQAGDLMGCVGRWKSGDWHGPSAEEKISEVEATLEEKPWLSW